MTENTTAPATVLSAEDVTERQALLTSALMDARMGRYLPFLDELVISHRALTERVRVLRGALSESEFAMNAVKNDVPWHVKDECMFDEALHIARRALAALEGSGE